MRTAWNSSFDVAAQIAQQEVNTKRSHGSSRQRRPRRQLRARWRSRSAAERTRARAMMVAVSRRWRRARPSSCASSAGATATTESRGQRRQRRQFKAGRPRAARAGAPPAARRQRYGAARYHFRGDYRGAITRPGSPSACARTHSRRSTHDEDASEREPTAALSGNTLDSTRATPAPRNRAQSCSKRV